MKTKLMSALFALAVIAASAPAVAAVSCCVQAVCCGMPCCD